MTAAGPVEPGARRAGLLAAALGALWFLYLGGAPTLNPFNVDWLGEGDRGSQYAAWTFLRGEALSFPLGAIEHLLAPVGTTAALTDTVPLVALPVRWVVSPWVAGEFQWFGWWLLACFVAQGYFGWAVLTHFVRQPAARLGGAAYLLASPVLVARMFDVRMGHLSLCAHGLLLAVLDRSLRRPSAGREVGAHLLQFGLLLVGALWIHPLWLLLTGGFWAGALLDLVRAGVLSPRRSAAAALATLGGAALSAWGLGYFDAPTLAAPGAGFFSADLLSWLNPQGWSRILPALAAGPGQYEGFAYLGLGGLASLLISVLLRSPPTPRTGTWTPWVLALACAFLACSSPVTVLGSPLFSLDWLYGRLGVVVDWFRSSGRLIWPLYYLVAAAVLGRAVAAVERLRPGTAPVVAWTLAMLQVADLRTDHVGFAGRDWRLRSPAWQLAAGDYRHLALVPPFVPGACPAFFPWETDLPLANLAARLNLTFNSGFAARVDAVFHEAVCAVTVRRVQAGEFAPDTLYVVPPTWAGPLAARGVTCGTLERQTVCARAEDQRSFARALRQLSGEPRPGP